MTESTNWRALCAELLDVIDFLCEGDTRPDSESVTRARAALAQPEPEGVTDEDHIKAAFAMGQTGAPPSETERLAFESWMRGHSWLVEGVWNGTTYDDRGPSRVSLVDVGAMQTRMLWAAWRDRAALAQPETPSRLHYCPTHGQQPENAWGCPECVREMRQQLSQPESEGMTDEDIQRIALSLPATCDWSPEHTHWTKSWNVSLTGLLIFARAILARYARPAIEPEPVAERLPEPEDCDARGWCWYWHPGEECWEMVPVVTGTWDEWSHWLPHCALPIPTP